MDYTPIMSPYTEGRQPVSWCIVSSCHEEDQQVHYSVSSLSQDHSSILGLHYEDLWPRNPISPRMQSERRQLISVLDSRTTLSS